jgi:hypothetical protein
MSYEPKGPRWWQANDGKWYRPDQIPGTLPPPPSTAPKVTHAENDDGIESNTDAAVDPDMMSDWWNAVENSNARQTRSLTRHALVKWFFGPFRGFMPLQWYIFTRLFPVILLGNGIVWSILWLIKT